VKQALEFLQDNQHYIADNERHAYVMEYNDFISKLEGIISQDALDKMAKNARELGLDYEPAPAQEGRDWSLLEATQESLREHMAEINRLQKEIIEQCRIIAMSAEREDALRAEIKRLKAAQPGVKEG
jgi:hypothetical protein